MRIMYYDMGIGWKNNAIFSIKTGLRIVPEDYGPENAGEILAEWARYFSMERQLGATREEARRSLEQKYRIKVAGERFPI